MEGEFSGLTSEAKAEIGQRGPSQITKGERMKLLLTICLLLASFGAVQAQNTELHLGPLFTRSDPNITNPQFRFDHTRDQIGFDSALTVFLGDRPFGLTADVAATWKGGADDSSLVTVMGGPTFKKRSGRSQPFARGLIGIGRVTAREQQVSLRFNSETSGLAYAVGGGLDINVSDHFAIRALQSDLLVTRIQEKNVRYLRAGVGIVVRF